MKSPDGMGGQHQMFLQSVSLAGQGQPAGSPVAWMLPMVAVFAIFYLLLILPSQRRQKKTAEMHRGLKSGDKVVTNGGIYGVVVGVDGDTIQLRVADQVKLKVARSAVAGLQQESKEG
ncbi:MAG TPA: preprotein translocase subunit YajC [Candidatus Acidoferrales bacterium]|nr:preprotein translocase subunit YajC [Candidatus Acidoferrales bacterium]